MADNPRIEDLKRRVRKDPASIAFAQLAEEYRRAGQFQESVDACHVGLGIHPNYLSARVTLGRALIEIGQLDEALRELELVLKSAPENLAAIRGIADIHHRQESFGKALLFYQKALGLARNDPDLEQTVADLTQLVNPTRGAEPKDGLSFEQMQREITARNPPPAAVTQAAPAARVPPSLPPTFVQLPSAQAQSVQPPAPRLMASWSDHTGPERNSIGAELAVAALEKWLEAINVTRANRSA